MALLLVGVSMYQLSYALQEDRFVEWLEWSLVSREPEVEKAASDLFRLGNRPGSQGVRVQAFSRLIRVLLASQQPP